MDRVNLQTFKRICILNKSISSAGSLVDFLESKLDIPCVVAKQPASLRIDINDLILLQVTDLDESKLLLLLGTLQSKHPDNWVCLFAVPADENISPFLSFPVVKGILHLQQSENIILKGIISMDKGVPWFSRKHANQLAALRVVPNVDHIDFPKELTRREKQVLRYLGKGYPNKKIAELLFLSIHTINTHRNNLYRKLGVQSHAEAVLWALGHQTTFNNP